MSQNSDYRYTRNGVIACDFVIFNVLYLVLAHYNFVEVPMSSDGSLSTYMVVANFAFAVAQHFFSNVVYHRRTTFEQVLRQVTMLCLVYIFVAIFLFYFIASKDADHAPILRFTLTLTLCLYAVLLISRYVEFWLLKRYRAMGHNTRHVALIGSDPALLPLYEFFSGDPTMGYSVNGYYADEAIQDCPQELLHKGTMADLEKVMEHPLANGVADEVYCCLPRADKALIKNIMNYCNNNAVHFYYVPAFGGVFGRSFSMKRIGGNVVFTRYNEPLSIPTNKFVKRTFDIVVSGITLLCMLPFIPILALIIKKQSPGPIFFKQLRTGLDGHDFYCYKFRSMHVNKDADTVQATENDPRKFAFGNFMRKANIDELPQFWNVFKGDMSIVGPRPHMLHHTDIYRELIDKYMVRHFVKPGITGWAQVTGFRGETKELWQMEGRVKRDIWYIENWSLWLDIRIIWKTFKSIFIHDKNAY